MTNDVAEDTWYVWSHLNESIKGLPEIASTVGNTFIDKPFENESMSKVWDFIKTDFHELIPVDVSLKEDTEDTEDTEDKENIKWNKNVTKLFLQHIREIVDVEDSFNSQRRVLEVLDAGNRCSRWAISIPYIPAPPPKKPASRFQSDGFAVFCRHQNLFDKLLASLSDMPKNDPELEWGQIFSVLMLFGGLVYGKRLLALPASLKVPNRHFHWLDLEIDSRDGTEKIQYRHFLEPISRYFLVKRYLTGISPPPKKLTSTKIFKLIKRYAEAQGFENELPGSWRELARVTKMRYAIYLPHHLLGHLTAETQSTSLSGQTIERLLKPLPFKPDDKSVFSSKLVNHIRVGIFEGSEKKEEEEGENEELWPAQLRELSSIIRDKTTENHEKPDQVKNWLLKYSGITGKGALLPSVSRLAKWVQHWLFKDGAGRRALKESSAYGHYNAIAGRLVGQLGDIDPPKLFSEADFIEIYSVALDDTATIGSRNRVAKGLKSFHAYLVKKCKVPDLSTSGLFNHKKGSSNSVDANFIDPVTFENAMHWLADQFQPEIADMLILVACLGYYSGLRRSEAVGLMLGDIEGEPDWDLHIKPNKYRSLKSSNADRISPLKCLWPSRHLNRFIRFYDRRCEIYARTYEESEGTQKKSIEDFPLFSLDGKENLRNNDPILDQITLALKQATHEEGLRYHHLRHSFGNRLLLMLWEAEHTDGEINEGCLPRMTGFDDVKATRDYLLGSAPLHRRGLWLIAKLMGHVDPVITVTHYLHFMDYLLGQALRRAVPEMNTGRLASLTGKSESHIKNLRHKSKNGTESEILDRLTESLIKKEFKIIREPVVAPSVLDPINIQIPENHFAQFILLSKHLNKNVSKIKTLEVIALPWTGKALTRMLATAKGLAVHFRKRDMQEHNGLIDVSNKAGEKKLAEAVFRYVYGDVDKKIKPLSEREISLLTQSYQMGKEETKNRWLNVRFEKIADAKRWIRFLKYMEILDLFTLEHCPCPSSKVGSAKVQREYWRTGTGLKINQEEETFNKVQGIPVRGLIIFEQKTLSGNGRHRAFYGICWALTMLRISTQSEAE
jgi:integrase